MFEVVGCAHLNLHANPNLNSDPHRQQVKLPDHIRHLPIICPKECIHITTPKKKKGKRTPMADPKIGFPAGADLLSSSSDRLRQPSDTSAMPEASDERGRQQVAFASADADKSGRLDFEEFSRMDINKKLGPATRKAIFEQLDTDRSGELTMEEFAMYRAAVKIQARHRGGRDRLDAFSRPVPLPSFPRRRQHLLPISPASLQHFPPLPAPLQPCPYFPLLYPI